MLTRRRFLTGTGVLAGAAFLAPVISRTAGVFGVDVDPATAQRRRLVIVNLFGGNDGLNVVVPMGDVPGAPRYSVYRQVRPIIGYDPAVVLPMDRPADRDHQLGLNPMLATVHRLYREDRIAVVQGVDYPDHSYSHFTSAAIWESGMPESQNDSGWIGRHLDRSGVGRGELRAVGVGTRLPQALAGKRHRGVEVQALPLQFADGTGDIPDARHAALASLGDEAWAESLRRFAAEQASTTVGVVDLLAGVPLPPATANPLANALLTARVLLTQPLGVEVVYVQQSGYDTHANQRQQHERLLTELDQAIEAFMFGTLGGDDLGIGPLPAPVAERTMLMTTSEFGRRIGENGGVGVAGTDHGAAGPALLIGPDPAAAAAAGITGVGAGVHGDHPELGTPALPADNLEVTTDLRSVYQSILEGWLGDPEPGYRSRYPALPGLVG